MEQTGAKYMGSYDAVSGLWLGATVLALIILFGGPSTKVGMGASTKAKKGSKSGAWSWMPEMPAYSGEKGEWWGKVFILLTLFVHFGIAIGFGSHILSSVDSNYATPGPYFIFVATIFFIAFSVYAIWFYRGISASSRHYVIPMFVGFFALSRLIQSLYLNIHVNTPTGVDVFYAPVAGLTRDKNMTNSILNLTNYTLTWSWTATAAVIVAFVFSFANKMNEEKEKNHFMNVIFYVSYFVYAGAVAIGSSGWILLFLFAFSSDGNNLNARGTINNWQVGVVCLTTVVMVILGGICFYLGREPRIIPGWST